MIARRCCVGASQLLLVAVFVLTAVPARAAQGSESTAADQVRLLRAIEVARGAVQPAPAARLSAAAARLDSGAATRDGGGSIDPTRDTLIVAPEQAGAIAGCVEGVEPGVVCIVTAWTDDRPDAEWGVVSKAAVTIDGGGEYRIEGLVPGKYFVAALADGYRPQYYQHADDLAAAVAVEVMAGGTAEKVDFALVPEIPGTGSIAGTVRVRADGHPLADATVYAFCVDDPFSYGKAATDADGTYAILGLRSGRYVVEVWAEGYLPQRAGNAEQAGELALIEVVEPEQTVGVDFALVMAGSISGTVRDAAGQPLGGVVIQAIMEFDPDSPAQPAGSEEREWNDGTVKPDAAGWAAWGVSEPDGRYRVAGLLAGTYRVMAQVSTSWYCVTAWYDGAADWEHAAPVQVGDEHETEGIDFVLDVPVASSAIAGRVTDTSGRPLAGAMVTVQSYATIASENSGGEGAGQDEEGGAPGDASLGSVSGSEVRRGVDAQLVWAYGWTDADGYYAVEGLPAGTYLVSAMADDKWEGVHRWYRDALSPLEATPVVLAAGERRADVDIALPLRLAIAGLSGVVRDQRGEPLAGAFIQVAPAEGTLADGTAGTGERRAAMWAYGYTDTAGAYRIDWLAAGTYTVYAAYGNAESYGQGWYDGADRPEAATPVVLAEGEQRGGIDFSLEVRPLYGTVYGQVSAADTGAPVARAYVELTPVRRDALRAAPLGFYAPVAVTDGDGRFSFEWVAEGFYTLTVHADGATGRWTEPATDDGGAVFAVRGGDRLVRDVVVRANRDGEGAICGSVAIAWQTREAPAVDAALGEAGVNIAPLAADQRQTLLPESSPPKIAVVKATRVDIPSPVDYTAITAEDGTYAVRGLPAGDYVVMAFAAGFVGSYYDGAYAADRAQKIRVEGGEPVCGIDLVLAPVYYCWAAGGAELDGGEGAKDANPATRNSVAGVYGTVLDESGRAVDNATVYVLDAAENAVGFAQTGADGAFELSGLAPGEYRLFASKAGYAGTYNGNVADFVAAELLQVAGGLQEVNIVLGSQPTAVTEDEAVTPLALALRRNYPNPFNPSTRISFAVPQAGRATVRVYNAIGQQVAVLFDGLAEAEKLHVVDFRAAGLAGGVYLYTLEFGGQRLVRAMTLAK